MPGLDRELFYWINRWPNELQPFFWFWSEAIKQPWMRGSLLLFLLILVWRKPLRPMALLALVAVPLANELTDLLKAWVKMPRPSVDFPDAIVRNVHLTSFGTASAHSANMAAVATVFFWIGGWRWGVPWVLIAFFTGLSRVYNAAHYPSQVLFGWFCGAVVGTLVVFAWRAWLRWRNPVTATPTLEESKADS